MLDRRVKALLVAFCLALIHAHGVIAHDLVDPALAQTDRIAGVRPETLTGSVHTLVVDDPAHAASSRYVELQLDDGTLVPLRGDGTAALPSGARASVTGQYDGKWLEVAAARIVGSASANVPKANAEVEGSFAILHADDFAKGRSSFIYEIHQASGKVNRLRLGMPPSVLAPGMRLRVVGHIEADGESIMPDRITILSQATSSNEAPGAIGKAAVAESVLVIMANFNNTAVPSFTPAQAQQVMTSNADSVANFFREASYGRQVMNVTVTPSWVRMNLAQPASCGTTDWQGIGNSAEAAARVLGAAYDPASYNFVVYVFPTVPACGWLGLAYIGSPRKAWINGTESFRTQAIAHEMGHNFGLLHAASLRCAGAVIGGSCSVSEYGDAFDTMGNQRAMHYNAMQKSKLGWIPSTSVKTYAGGAATYTLSPLEVAGASTYAVKIPTGSANRTYWLEFRQPIGFDAPLSAFPNNGAQIRVSSPFETLCAGCDSWNDDTELLDTTPGSSAFTDATLTTGRTFTDTTYGINVTVLSASSSALTVQVATGSASSPAPATTTTTLAAAPNPSVAGAVATFTATVTGIAPTGAVAFSDNGSPIAGCTAVPVGGSGNVSTASCATTWLVAGTHTIVARYSGDALNEPSASGAVDEVVDVSLLDHYYESILGRAPDPGGRAFWDGEVELMQSLGVDAREAYRVMGVQFFNSQEYLSSGTSDAQYITALYHTFLNRAPDAEGLAYWSDQLRAGSPRNMVLYSFLFSTEFNNYMAGLLGNTTARAEVDAVVDFYRGLLRRLPDRDGFTYWVGRLRAAQCAGDAAASVYASVKAISKQFISSTEYASQHTTNAEYVSDLYDAFLRRGGDVSELTYWRQRLDTGVEDRDAMRIDFIGSREFNGRVNAIIAQGCQAQ